MNAVASLFSSRVVDATKAVFGDSPMTHAVSEACRRYEQDLQNIRSGRGINALLIAIVGAKGQGKTWVARQFVRDGQLKSQLRSGDLIDDATTRLVWVGPTPPDVFDPASEIYFPCEASQMVDLGQPYVLLDTPGLTDANHRAARLAEESLSLAPLKILVIARDQIRAAVNTLIAQQIDGAYCIPVITSVEPDEMPGEPAGDRLHEDLRTLRDKVCLMAPRSQLTSEVLVPDFEITGDEEAAARIFVGALLDCIHQLGITELALGSARDERVKSATLRLRGDVARLIGDQLPQLAAAVQHLNRETEKLPERVLASLLGSESVLETGVRMRLRARLVGDTYLLWFPYRTMMSTLNLTQGAWDRVMLAMAGSVPSLFGALASLAKNVREHRDLKVAMHDGIYARTQQQVEERLRPLCNQFHRAVMRLRPTAVRSRNDTDSIGMRLAGIEELQNRSQQIFDHAIRARATSNWMVQTMALIGVALFWVFMAGPIVLIYREYLMASVDVFRGQESTLENFPHPTPSLLFTSLMLSMLPMALYCMIILTFFLRRHKVRRVVQEIMAEHEATIDQLKQEKIIRLDFEDQLLVQAEFLLNLRDSEH